MPLTSEAQTTNKSGFAVELHVYDAAFNPLDTLLLRLIPQEAREEGRVHVVRVVNVSQGRRRIARIRMSETVETRHHTVQRVMVEMFNLPTRRIFQPELVWVQP